METVNSIPITSLDYKGLPFHKRMDAIAGSAQFAALSGDVLGLSASECVNMLESINIDEEGTLEFADVRMDEIIAHVCGGLQDDKTFDNYCEEYGLSETAIEDLDLQLVMLTNAVQEAVVTQLVMLLRNSDLPVPVSLDVWLTQAAANRAAYLSARIEELAMGLVAQPRAEDGSQVDTPDPFTLH